MNKNHTQTERIKEWFKNHNSLTQLEAYEELGIWRLASRMHELKTEGYKFHGETVKSTNRFGEKISYSRYVKGE